MKNYGLTPEEQKTGLQEYNHALFQNMAAPLTLVWEINPSEGAVCIMHDTIHPEYNGHRFEYEEHLNGFSEAFVYADDRDLFKRHMSIGMLSTLNQEKTFYCHVQSDEEIIQLYCFTLTPLIDEHGKPERIYFSAMDLHDDIRSMNESLEDDEEMVYQRVKPNYKAYLILGLLTLALVVGVIYGIFTIRQKLYIQTSNSLQHIVQKVGVNIDTVMDNKWTEADYIAGQLASRKYTDMNSFNKELGLINELAGKTGSRVVVIDKNAVAHKADGSEFKWTNRGSLSEGDKALWVTELPAMGDRETKLTYTTKLDEPITIGDVTITHVSLICDMKVLDDFLAMRDYGEESVTYIIRSTGGNVYRQSDSDSELANMFNVLSALQKCEYGYGSSYETMANDIASGRSGSVYARINGRSVFVAYQKLAALDWYAVVMVPDELVAAQTNSFATSLIGIIVIFALGLIALIIALFIVQEKERRKQEAANINALRRAALKMSRAAALEHSANEAKTRFLSSMSHDIRTPMNAIVGLTVLASNHVDDREYVKECLEKMTKAGNHLLSLINDVLDISKVESGSMSLNIESFSLKDVITNLVDIVRNQAAAKQQNVVVDTEGISVDGLVGDELRLSQIFLNIASNAVKYTPDGGHIAIKIAQEEIPDDPDSIRLIYVVKDDGIGMSEEFQKTMYNAFSRETDHRVNKVLGTGLGLAICKQMVDLMNGTIECDSHVGEGTTFTVTIVLRRSEEPVSHHIVSDKSESSETIAGMRILIAEDNEMNWEIISELLSDYGVICERAENGKICVDMMHEAPEGYYKAILMDVQMPVMGGREASMELRGSDMQWIRNIPIIAMTADAFAEDIKACLDAGMNAHLAKPVNMQKVLDTLEKYCLGADR